MFDKATYSHNAVAVKNAADMTAQPAPYTPVVAAAPAVLADPVSEGRAYMPSVLPLCVRAYSFSHSPTMTMPVSAKKWKVLC